jgi:hypothetical protein
LTRDTRYAQAYLVELEKLKKSFELRYRIAKGNLIELEKRDKRFELRHPIDISMSGGAGKTQKEF